MKKKQKSDLPKFEMLRVQIAVPSDDPQDFAPFMPGSIVTVADKLYRIVHSNQSLSLSGLTEVSYQNVAISARELFDWELGVDEVVESEPLPAVLAEAIPSAPVEVSRCPSCDSADHDYCEGWRKSLLRRLDGLLR